MGSLEKTSASTAGLNRYTVQSRVATTEVDQAASQLLTLVDAGHDGARVVDAAEELAKGFKISAFDLARRLEVVLNNQYKQGHSAGSVIERQRRRQVLRWLKQSRTVKYNANLAGEWLGLGTL